MLQHIAHFILISIFCVAWGLPLCVLKKKLPQNLVGTTELIVVFFCGLAILGIISSWISVFTAPRLALLVIPTVVLLIGNYILIKRRNIRFDVLILIDLSITEKFFLAGSIILFITLSVGNPVLVDTDLYHIQSIKWIHEYGTVTGLGNLYLRYGLYSNWFHLISIFELPFTPTNFLSLNLTIAIWFLFFLFNRFKTANKNHYSNPHLSLYYLLVLFYMFFEWNLFREGSSSTSYDFVITCITFIAIDFFVCKLMGDDYLKNDLYVLLLIVSAPFFKITGALILPFLVLYLFFVKARWKKNSFIVGFGLLAAVPFIYKNYMQTGYPLFPYDLFQFNTPSWQVPNAMLKMFQQYIYLTNHFINQQVPDKAWIDNSSFSYLSDWYYFLTRQDKFLIGLSLLGIPLSLMVLKKYYRPIYLKLLLYYLISYIVLFFWLLHSPDTRFVFSFLLFTGLFSLSLTIKSYFKERMQQLSLLVAGICIVGYTVIKLSNENLLSLLVSPKKTQTPQYQSTNVNGVEYHVPEKENNNWNARCYDAPLPCVYNINPYLEKRPGEKFDGFQMRQVPDSNFIKHYDY